MCAYLNELKKLRAEIESDENELSQYRKDYPKEIGTKGWLALLKDDFSYTHDFLVHEYENNNLPRSELSESVINQILESVDQVCICSRHLNDAAKSALNEKLEWIKARESDSGSDYIHEEELYKLMDKVNPLKNKSPQNFYFQVSSFRQDIPDLKGKMSSKRRLIKSKQTRYDKDETRFKNQDNKRYKKIAKDIENIKESLKALHEKKGEKRANRQAKKNELIKVKRSLGQMRKPPNVDNLEEQIKLLNRISKYNESFKEELVTLVHTTLQKKTQEMYATLYRSGNSPIINKDSFLPEITKDGVKIALGGAESQCLALAFMMALNDARTELNEHLRKLEINIVDTNEHAAVLDSILAPIEQTYRKSIAKHIPANTPQTILLLANQQWDDGKDIGAAIKKNIGKIYYFDCETSDPDYAQAPRKMSCFGKKITVMKFIKNAKRHTKIKEIETW